ncbi:aspartate/glutamate racemase family protein [Algicella marina]|uniref:Hydrogenase expression protein HupH n=1 Tax=Algicella marina TaxID=2683284 RepID=A0A6P1SV90_9RHOB|nr:aspartate/glutamate racemase family protein [Algicella marina]QHQ34368.1 hydrogenase expression protein HupH [Algicella marina]
MKILLLNPNMTTGMTDGMAEVARLAASPGTEIIPVTATRGFPYISSRAESQFAGTITLEIIADYQDQVDAVVVAAFGDPGLHAARELYDLPVTGLAEAAILTACMLGERFAIVTFTPDMIAWYALSVAAAGVQSRLSGFHAPERQSGSLGNLKVDMRAELTRLAQEAAAGGADCVILGGAPLAGLASEIAEEVPAVLIDPVACAVRQAETLALLAPDGASKGSYRRPPGKATTGLPAALAAQFEGDG